VLFFEGEGEARHAQEIAAPHGGTMGGSPKLVEHPGENGITVALLEKYLFQISVERVLNRSY
jgi:hypothetical protein